MLTAAFGGTNLFHAVNFSGGGFAVFDASGDGAAPLAFSIGGEFCETNAAPLWTMLLADTGVRSARSKSRPLLCADGKSPTLPEGVSVSRTTVSTSARLLPTTIETEAGLDDLRVAPLVQSKWDQSTVGSKNVYNYYTPGNCVCGCVATAMAQIMRFHEYPTASVIPQAKMCTYKGSNTRLTMQGGVYDWSLMPLAPDASITDAERMAIGKLTGDVGISVHMNYEYGTEISAAYNPVAVSAMTNIWGYAQAKSWYNLDFNHGTSTDGYVDAAILHNSILANLDAGYPCLVGVYENGAGHSIVADGYGYLDSQRYIHFNVGWGGSSDYWYTFPVLDYSYFDSVVYNIFPTNTGNVVSGRVTDTNGVALANVTVKAYDESENLLATAVSSEKGIYALIVPNEELTLAITAKCFGFGQATSNGVMTAVSVSQPVDESVLESDPTNGNSIDLDAEQVIGNRWGVNFELEPRPHFLIRIR